MRGDHWFTEIVLLRRLCRLQKSPVDGFADPFVVIEAPLLLLFSKRVNIYFGILSHFYPTLECVLYTLSEPY